MIGYRQRLGDDLQARSNMITEASEEFLEKMSKTGRGQWNAGAVSEKCTGCGAVGQKYLHFV